MTSSPDYSSELHSIQNKMKWNKKLLFILKVILATNRFIINNDYLQNRKKVKKVDKTNIKKKNSIKETLHPDIVH